MDFMTLYPDEILFFAVCIGLIVLSIFSPSGTSKLTKKIDSLQKQISRMDSNLTKIANQVGVPVDPKDPFDEELKSIIKKDGKIMAIKKVTLVTGLGLKEAKEYVEDLMESKDFANNS